MLADALNTPVSVMETAGEGGAWGMAVLADYSVNSNGMPLDEYLNEKVFVNCKSSVIAPDEADCDGFDEYMKLFKQALNTEKSAYCNL